MKSYKHDAERNLWHAAAEQWRDNGRSYIDEARFLGPRRWPLPLPVVAFVVVVAAALTVWHLVCG